jgi:2-methylcitrate dehydratase
MTAETAYPKGHRGNPLSDAEVEAKFRGLAAGVPRERADRVLAEIWGLDGAATLDALLDAAAVR